MLPDHSRYCERWQLPQVAGSMSSALVSCEGGAGPSLLCPHDATMPALAPMASRSMRWGRVSTRARMLVVRRLADEPREHLRALLGRERALGLGRHVAVVDL